MKTKHLLIVAAATIVPCVANASLTVTTGSTLGSSCYTDTGAKNNGVVLIKCVGADVQYYNYVTAAMYNGIPDCPNSYDLNTLTCVIGQSGNAVYMCDTADPSYNSGFSASNIACQYCPQRGGGTPFTGAWGPYKTGMVSRTKTTYNYTNTANYTCTESVRSSTTEYGCQSGYWTEDARGVNMECESCPDNATCGGTGNAEVFSCNKGYFRAGTACMPCPSSGGIAGTTKTAGATDASECYLPAGSTGSDSTGTYTLTGDCYWK